MIHGNPTHAGIDVAVPHPMQTGHQQAGREALMRKNKRFFNHKHQQL